MGNWCGVEPGRQAAGIGRWRPPRHRLGCGDRSEALDHGGHNDFVDAVVWSPDGTRLASAGIDNSVRVWDPRTGEETFVLRGNCGMFHDVSWHPDGAQLAAASNDGQLWVWDATLGLSGDFRSWWPDWLVAQLLHREAEMLFESKKD